MTNELSLDVVQSQLKPQQRLTVSQDTLDEINKLAENPEYGPEFLDCYLDHLNIFKDNPKRSHTQYLSAIKFFSLVEAENTLTDAYIKTFPGRYEDRCKNKPYEDRDKSIMRGEASRYNNSMLVNEIRKVAAIPVQLIHRHVLHEAILEQADLMRNAKSEMVRQKAGACLITELKPMEDQVLNVKVEDNTGSVIEDLRKAAEKLAAAEYQSVMAGVPLKVIADADIITDTTEVLEEDEEEVAETEIIDDVAVVVEDEPEVIAVMHADKVNIIETTLPDKEEVIKPKHKGRWHL
ncbi:MAG: hypothetical protein GQ576_03180 [Methanococcoides sp.]|nr:hypothetical protein [Methanococcoides sp.]